MEKQNSPVISILLFQSFLSAAAFVLLLYVIVSFASSSLGYSSSDSSLLIILALAAFAIPHVLISTTEVISKGVTGIWFYLVNLLLCVFILLSITQNIEVLLGTGAKVVIFIVAITVSFCSGLAHRQVTLFTGKLYPGVWFWSWYMTSVGVVLGMIIAQYVLIEFDMASIVRAAMEMFLFTAIIAWWCLTAVQDKPGIKNNSLEKEPEL